MKSALLGKIALDQRRLARDVATCLKFSGSNEHYSEFYIGNWKTYVIWNSSGDDADGVVHEVPGAIRPTARGDSLPYVGELIREHFHLERLALARVHILGDGVLIPHRDYVELDKNLLRVHVPLQTNERCLHSEQDTAFVMGQGEVWDLYAGNTHSAVNFSPVPRVNLCLDFHAEAGRHEQALSGGIDRTGLTPRIKQRLPLGDAQREAIRQLAPLLHRDSYRDVLGFLARMHFLFEVSNEAVFDWLLELARSSRNEEIYEHTLRYRTFLLQRREFGERSSYYVEQR